MTGEERDHPFDGLLAAIGQGADDGLARASAASRSQRRWLSQQAAESTTLAGVLLTRAERDETVSITAAMSTFRGRLTLVTTRVCVIDLEGAGSGVALVPTAAITAIEGRGGEVAITDERVPAGDTDLGIVLATVAADRPSITVHLTDGTELSGALLDVGFDVLALRRSASTVHVRLGAVAACVVR